MNILEKLYPEVEMPLYHVNPFTLLVAVLLSAQCTDDRVNRVTKNSLFPIADTQQKMARISLEKLELLIKSCGFYKNKAKFIKSLSQNILHMPPGNVPDTFEELEKLPGIGHKSASVIMSYIYKVPAFPVDTHIHRLSKRWGISSGKNVIQTEKDIKAVFPKKKWNKLHLQIIFFGREYCKARGHKILDCPICSLII